MSLKQIYTPFRIIQYEAFTNVTMKYLCLIGTSRHSKACGLFRGGRRPIHPQTKKHPEE